MGLIRFWISTSFSWDLVDHFLYSSSAAFRHEARSPLSNQILDQGRPRASRRSALQRGDSVAYRGDLKVGSHELRLYLELPLLAFTRTLLMKTLS